MFRTLGVAPALGRDFNEDEDRVGAPKVIILERPPLARPVRRRDATSIGQEIMVNGVKHTVIGVMPPGFEFPVGAGAWTTMQIDPLEESRQPFVAGHRAAQAWRDDRAGARRPRAHRGDARDAVSERRTPAGASTSQTLREYQVGQHSGPC